LTKRVRTYDAEDIAIGITETFKDRPFEFRENMSFGWPRSLQNVGDSLAVAYESDKWKPKDAAGRREAELYKHLAESRNSVYVKRGLLKDYYKPNRGWPVKGAMISFTGCPMPRHFAILGLFEEASLQLYTDGTAQDPEFGKGEDDGIVKVTIGHGMLGASKMLWSREDPNEPDEPFLFVYTKSAGVLMFIVGDKLDVKRDGIVG
jgi:hypothetical protein